MGTFNVSQCIHRTNGRNNARNFDLNRSFPDIWKYNKTKITEAEFFTEDLEAEVRAMVEWNLRQPFVLSANFHGGAMVASYPWDSVDPKILGRDPRQGGITTRKIPSLTSDDEMYVKLASEYSLYNSRMYTQRGLGRCLAGWGGPFNEGITNGAAWYSARGTLQDFVYKYTNSLAITLEVSCCKHPHPRELPQFWQENMVSLLMFSGMAHTGVKGQVVDEEGVPVKDALVNVVHSNHRRSAQKFLETTERGEFWKLLPPGNYLMGAVLPQCLKDPGSPSCKKADVVKVTVTDRQQTEAVIVTLVLKRNQPHLDLRNTEQKSGDRTEVNTSTRTFTSEKKVRR